MKTNEIVKLSQTINTAEIPLTALTMLAVLKDYPGINVSTLAVYAGISNVNCSNNLIKLRKAKYIVQADSETDRRISVVNLTKQGEEFLNKILDYVSGKTEEKTKEKKTKKAVRETAPVESSEVTV